jgi:hypothetical protein
VRASAPLLCTIDALTFATGKDNKAWLANEDGRRADTPASHRKILPWQCHANVTRTLAAS